jgi:hypothetical protein
MLVNVQAQRALFSRSTGPGVQMVPFVKFEGTESFFTNKNGPNNGFW